MVAAYCDNFWHTKCNSLTRSTKIVNRWDLRSLITSSSFQCTSTWLALIWPDLKIAKYFTLKLNSPFKPVTKSSFYQCECQATPIDLILRQRATSHRSSLFSSLHHNAGERSTSWNRLRNFSSLLILFNWILFSNLYSYHFTGTTIHQLWNYHGNH